MNSTFRRVTWLTLVVCLFSLIFGSFVATQMSAKAQAATAPTITEFPLLSSNAQAEAITAGPDGNVWFGDYANIGRVTPNGTVTNFPIIGNGFPTVLGLTKGPDGNVWFTGDINYKDTIGEIDSSGVVSKLPTGAGGPSLATGSDGNLWFPDQGTNSIGRFTPSGVVIEFSIPTANSGPTSIVAGPDGNLWFTEGNSKNIGRITPNGTITEFPVLTMDTYTYPFRIAAGPDGNLWFTEATGNGGHVYNIGRITPNGITTEFRVPTFGSQTDYITAGPDGNVWFTEEIGQIGRITPNGVITEYPIPTQHSDPRGITTGPDGNIWFTENQTNKIGRVNIAGLTATPPTVTNTTFTGTEGQTGSGIVHAQSASGSPLTLTATGLPSFASFKDNGNGTGTVSYSPKAGNAGTYTFSVTASDGSQTRTGTVTLTVAKATPRKNLVVVVDGIDSSLEATPTQAQARGGDGQDSNGFFASAGNVDGIIPFLQSDIPTYKNARIIVYSYSGYHGKGQPNAYTCRDTFVNSIVQDASHLADQINAALKSDPNPNQDITLLGHSQGGLVLLTYITALVANNGSVHGLPAGAKIKYAATFDSPLGGMSDASAYRSDAEGFFRAPLVGCSKLQSKDRLVSLDNMQAVYKTATNKDARGETASILSALLKGKNTKTQDILTQAKSLWGLSFISFANMNDLLWLPGDCNQNLQNFPSTAWIGEGGKNSRLYRRTFTAGKIGVCFFKLNVAFSHANHGLVLNNAFVERALLEFLIGLTPDNF